MAAVGFSPPTRVFEAAGAGACLITDYWKGIETYFEPEKEILVANNAKELASYLRNVPAERAKEIGDKMRARALREHTYALRAQQFESIVAMAPMPALN